jgi:hypothetical protein
MLFTYEISRFYKMPHPDPSPGVGGDQSDLKIKLKSK